MAIETQTPFACPCCREQTLRERGAYDVCPICKWEDDGQGDHNADEVIGGPNGDLSLAQARKNFAVSFHCNLTRRPGYWERLARAQSVAVDWMLADESLTGRAAITRVAKIMDVDNINRAVVGDRLENFVQQVRAKDAERTTAV